MSTTYPNKFLALPFLRASNGVFSFWVSDTETVEVRLADQALARAASIVLFQDNETIDIQFGQIDPNLYLTETPVAEDFVLYFDQSTSTTKKTSITDLIGGSGGSAAADLHFVTTQAESGLSNESVLTAGTGITVTSGATISVDFTTVQAKDTTLTSIAALGTAADRTIYTTGVDTWSETPLSSYARTLIDDANASTARGTLGLDTMATQAANNVTITGGSITGITDLVVADGGTGASDAAGARTNLGLIIGTNVQAYDAELAALAGVTSAADALPYFTGSGTATTTTLSSYARTLIDDSDAATARSTLGLGTLATQSGTFSGTSSGTNTGDQNVFTKIAVSGQSDIDADSASDTLTLVAGTNITITTNAGTDSITINSSGGGGGISDGDKGDIIVSSSGTVWTVDNDVVTYAKIQNVSATDRLLGRDTASAGDIEEISVSGGIEFTGSTGIQTSAFTGDVTKTAGGTALTLATVNSNVGSFGSGTQVATFTVNGKGLITAASNTAISITSSGVSDFTEASQDAVGAAFDSSLVYTDGSNTMSRAALTGDVTASAGSNSTTIANNVVTYAKMQDISATQRVLGRNTAGSGDPEEVTASQLLSWIGSTQGQILFHNGTAWTVLSPGTVGQVLQTGGAGGNPSWTSAGASSFDYGKSYMMGIGLFNS